MKIGFIGCPCSGKTTTAAMVFSALKEMGLSCEFIVEQARLYIAQKRYDLCLRPEEGLALTDQDQILIMAKQIDIEEMFSKVCNKETVIVADSSPFNSLLYMSENQRKELEHCTMISDAVAITDLIFYAPPVVESYAIDTNRVHSLQQSLEVDKQIEPVLRTYAPSVWKTIIPLNGEPNARLSQVMAAIMKRRFQ